MCLSSDLLSARRRSVPANLSISYAEAGGLHIVRGAGAYLYDAHGRCYLDAVNNVAHVGHSNKLVNQRLQDQQSRVNTNTRYLSTTLSTYTSRLLAHCPTPLSDGKCFLVASGSEANDLAMRLCRAHAHARRGKQEQRPSDTSTDIFICLAFGYHGATNSVIDISPYKYRSKGGRGRARHIIEVDVLAEGFDEAKQQHELKALQAAIDQALAAGHSICGFFAESVLSCAGQVFLPPSFMQALYRIVRAAGGLCVADEVQVCASIALEFLLRCGR
jgi:4-aminobutyrate aminotransferase-like enzyme